LRELSNKVFLDPRYSLPLKQSMLFLGSFIFGHTTQRAIHELGHAIGTWITGGEVYGIFLHPFLPGHCYHSKTAYPGITTWAGAAFSVCFGVLLIIILWKRRAPLLAPLFAIGIFSLFGNGSYFIVGLLSKFGDPWYIVERLGMSAVWPILFGVASIGIGVIVCAAALGPVFGFDRQESIGKQVLFLNVSVQVFFLVTLVYRHVTAAGGRFRTTLYMAGSFILILVVVIVSKLKLADRVMDRGSRAAVITWPSPLSALGLGITIVIIELLMFA
jgi:hypothetical protein